MWDAALIARVRDRKLNEILIFASLAKIDTSKIDDYIDIIVSLGDDIDACDTLLETDGDAEITLEPIASPDYLSRLSPGERADEDAFNSMKSVPEDDGISEMEYLKGVISEAVDAIIYDAKIQGVRGSDDIEWEMEGLRDAFLNVLGELNEANDRISELKEENSSIVASSSSLESESQKLRLENSRITEEIDLLRRQCSELRSASDECAALKDEMSLIREDAAKIHQTNEALHAEIDRTRYENDGFKSKVATLEEDLVKSGDIINELRDGNSELARRIDSLTTENQGLASDRARAVELEKEVASLRDELSVANDTVSELRARIESLTIDVARVRELESTRVALEEEVSALRESKSNAVFDLGIAMKERDSFRASVESLTRELASMESQVSLLRDGQGGLAAESERLKSENAELSARLSEAESAASSLESAKEALGSLKDELRTVRMRNEELSAELDYCKEAVATAEKERDEAREALDSIVLSAPCAPAEVPVGDAVSDAPVVEEIPDVPAVSEPEEAPRDESRPVVDRILTDEEVDVLNRVAEMKDRQIDEFIDMSMDGSMREDVSDDIVTFLKVDSEICRILTSIDMTDLDSIVSGFRKLLDTLEDAPDAHFQKVYLSKISPEERELENRYVAIMDRVHSIISGRYMRFMGRSSA